MAVHARWVRVSHWMLAASALTLAVSGFVILMAHPRLYWGKAGNDLLPAPLELPISRNHRHGGWAAAAPIFEDAAGPISANRTYEIFNQNGWGRSLHNTDLARECRRLQTGGFAEWKLAVEGSVATPRTFSLVELTQLPSRTQITRHACEEGWSAIGEWTGVPLRLVLEAAGILPSARFVVYSAYDDWIDSIDMLDATHPQTILAYGMNGRDLPVPHGAPVRLRVETQLGAKSMKFLQRLVVVDEFDDGGARGPIQNGWAWHMGI